MQLRTTVTPGGRIVIPASIRKELQLEVGQEVLLTVESGELHVTTLKSAVEHAKALVRKHNPKKKSLTDALIASRREEAKDE